MLATLLQVASPQAIAAPAPSQPAATATPEQRDTLLAAQIAARNSGRRVEVLDLRTETTTTYAVEFEDLHRSTTLPEQLAQRQFPVSIEPGT